MNVRAASPNAFAALALAFALLFAAGCGRENEVFSVRGQVAGRADGGKALRVDHEEIPGQMAAMQMELPLQDPAAASGIAAGDKIRFELYRSGGRMSIGKIEKLPADTELRLAAPPAGG